PTRSSTPTSPPRTRPRASPSTTAWSQRVPLGAATARCRRGSPPGRVFIKVGASMSDFSQLSIAGRVATPADPDWDEARQAWNLAADQRPSAVAFAESADDVAKVVRFAGQNGLRVTGQGTGHGAVALGSLDDAILIKTERMRGVEVDADAQAARVEAGALSLELGEAANRHGLCSLPGSSPDVGLVGYTLGGGLSWLGRQYGFACNRVSAIEVVAADGEPRRVDAE